MWKEFQPLNMTCKGVMVVLHGLNHLPADMDDLCERISRSGYHVIRGLLSGHEDQTQSTIVEPSSWAIDTFKLVEYGKKVSKYYGVELTALGFSTGNLCFLNALKNHNDNLIKKLIMIAPPLSFTLLGNSARSFSFLPKNTYVPTPDPTSKNRACDRLNASYYRAFFQIYDEFHASVSDVHNIPSLLIGHVNDEIIATRKFDDFIKKKKMTNWESHFVYDEKIRRDSYFHIIVSTHYWGSTAHKIAQKAIFWLEQ
jgi:esterase/lipase